MSSVLIPHDLAIEALQALYWRHRSALATTAGLMMSAREALGCYDTAQRAREALERLGTPTPDPTDDPWVGSVIQRAKLALVEGRGDVRHSIGPGGPLP